MPCVSSLEQDCYQDTYILAFPNRVEITALVPRSNLAAGAVALKTIDFTASALTLDEGGGERRVAGRKLLAGGQVMQCPERDARVPWLPAAGALVKAVKTCSVRQTVMIQERRKRIQSAAPDVARSLRVVQEHSGFQSATKAARKSSVIRRQASLVLHGQELVRRRTSGPEAAMMP